MKDITNVRISIEKMSHAADLPLPGYSSNEAAGMDLRAALSKEVHLKPGERLLIPTGLKIELPVGYEAQIRPRSGLAYKKGITMLNSPGTIDSDYRGEIKLLAINHGQETFTISHGDRIAQMVIAPVTRANISEVKKVGKSERGEGGFGSTGVN